MSDVILDVRHLSHRFRLNRRLSVQALDDLSFQIRRGEIFSLVGESGCGKSTAARCIMNLCRPTSGEIFFKDINVCDPTAFRRHKKELQTRRQLIFQDSSSSLNPRMTAADIITEPLRLHRITPKRGTYRDEAAFQLKYMGLDESFLDKYPPELSGGQRQRIAIARAVSMEPELLVADEPIASLDVSIQAQIINLFLHLREEHGFSFLFIAHDLAMVEYLSDRVGVMYRGRLVELAETTELFSHPLHPYTQALLSAIPVPDPRAERARPVSALDERTFSLDGTLQQLRPGHFVRCGKERDNG